MLWNKNKEKSTFVPEMKRLKSTGILLMLVLLIGRMLVPATCAGADDLLSNSFQSTFHHSKHAELGAHGLPRTQDSAQGFIADVEEDVESDFFKKYADQAAFVSTVLCVLSLAIFFAGSKEAFKLFEGFTSQASTKRYLRLRVIRI